MILHHSVYIHIFTDGLRGSAAVVVRGGSAAPFIALDWYGDCNSPWAALPARLKIGAGRDRLGLDIVQRWC